MKIIIIIFIIIICTFVIQTSGELKSNLNSSLNIVNDELKNTIEMVENEEDILSRITNLILNQIHIPGTKWCGKGNVSSDLNDLGSDVQTDLCCRNHDLCPLSINSGASRFGLYNDGNFYRSHCNCDKKFYACLKTIDHIIAKITGQLYFNILAPPCFKLEYPVISCLRQEANGYCVEYNFDVTAKKTYQWFENPTF